MMTKEQQEILAIIASTKQLTCLRDFQQSTAVRKED